MLQLFFFVIFLSGVVLAWSHEICGDVGDVPYPFGLGNSGNFKNPSFKLVCDYSRTPHTLMFNTIPVLNISIENGTAILEFEIAYTCYNESGGVIWNWNSYLPLKHLEGSPFTLSSTQNNFVVVGYNALGVLRDNTTVVMACPSFGFSKTEMTYCPGDGCTQTPVRMVNHPSSLKDLWITVNDLGVIINPEGMTTAKYNSCNYAFLASKEWTNYPNFDLKYNPGMKARKAPVVVDWAIGNKACQDPKRSVDLDGYSCGLYSICISSNNSLGYRCVCKEGYEGNPYVSTGCTDINECADPKHNLCKGRCKNTPGNYTCPCPFGKYGDAKVGCSLRIVTKVAIAIGTGVLLLTLALYLSWVYKNQIQEKNRRRNGGLLLKHLSVKIFKEAQLEKATNNFDAHGILGEGGNGWVYKGLSDDKTEIAVKKSKVVDQNQIEHFLNEVDIVSKINHKNVVKLLGVCLETKVPMLVYEFVPNGTLFHHIHGRNPTILHSWSRCLRIAAETAGALEYMHSLAYPPIIHRDIKSANILLDGNYTAKVSDFGASKLVPLGRTIPYTRGQGTMGYLDPEYVQTGELTIKSDVYGFGVVLMELLSKRKALSQGTAGEMISIVMLFTSALEHNQLDQFLEFRDVKEFETEEIYTVAKLAVRCVAMPSTERPTMKEVADVLDELNKEHQHVQADQGSCEELVSLIDHEQFVTTPMHFELE